MTTFTERGYTFNAVQDKGGWIVHVTGHNEFNFFVKQDYEPRYGVDEADFQRLEKISDKVLKALPDIEAVRDLLGDSMLPKE